MIAAVYTKAIHENLKPYYANWEPGSPVKLGDYGLLNGDSFTYLGNLDDLGISFAKRQDDRPDRKSFTSKGASEIKVHAKGKVTAKAAVEINLLANDIVYFNAVDCLHSSVRDIPALGRKIMERFQAKTWDRHWVVVTDLIDAGATTVAVSSGGASSMMLEAELDVETIDLADAAIQLGVRSENNVGYKVIAGKGMTPLIGLSGIQSSLLGRNKKFTPMGLSRDGEIEAETEDDNGDLFFAQLR